MNQTLSLFLEIDEINDDDIRLELYKKLKKTLIPEWTIYLDKELYFNNDPSSKFINQNDHLIYKNKSIEDTQYKKYIMDAFNSSNEINDVGNEVLSTETIDKIYDLHNLGVIFHFKDSPSEIIPINKNDILFPICDVGKNRSQYMFYYLKHLQSHYPNTFKVGYPSSGDELASIYNINAHNESILSGFSVGYKADNFSESLYKDVYDAKSGKIYSTIPNNPFAEISRSIHVFDSILKEKEEYLAQDLRNKEGHKYRINKYDIFDKGNQDLINIKELYKKYFLTPYNIRKIINYQTEKVVKYRITYICMSAQSFAIMCNIFHLMKTNDKLFDLSNVRIVYFAVKDIFQRSFVNQNILNDFRTKINSSFCYVEI
jgi:hypothetical protein